MTRGSLPYRNAGLLLVALASVACATPNTAGTPGSSKRAAPLGNVERSSFASSRACQGCHPDVYDKWSRSPMHRMTRAMAAGVSRAPFDGSRFRFKGDVATMTTQASRRYMHLESAKYPSAWYRITKVIGGRYREDYAGVEVAGPGAEAAEGSEERILPVSYLLFDRAWRYKGYSVMSPERDGLRRGPQWRTSCIFCHNTAPWLSLYYDELYGVGAPTYQGSASLKLPAERQLSYRVTDESAFERALEAELSAIGAEPAAGDDVPELLEAAAAGTLAAFSEADLVEVGIGCEACHGGARAHAERPDQYLPEYAPESQFLATTTRSGAPVPRPLAMTHSCAKCHTVLFSRYPHTWEGGERGFAAGGSSMNSGEARDFLLGDCTSKLTCSTCHDPHGEDDKEALGRLQSVSGNPVCTQCHRELAAPAALTRHTKHSPEGNQSACVVCHMPKKNVALNYELGRYHRIGSPTDAERVEKDRPLECALCHTDRSVLDLVTSMERLWNKRFDRSKLAALYGSDLRVNALSATLRSGKPHERVVAIYTSGVARRAEDTELILNELNEAYPLIRFYAKDALERISGRTLDVDMHLPGPELEDTVRRLLAEDSPKAPSPSDEATTNEANTHATPR